MVGQAECKSDEKMKGYFEHLKKRPCDAEVLAKVGEAYMAQGDMAAAESTIDFALHCDSGVSAALMAKHRLLVTQGKPKEAGQYLMQAQKSKGYKQPDNLDDL